MSFMGLSPAPAKEHSNDGNGHNEEAEDNSGASRWIIAQVRERYACPSYYRADHCDADADQEQRPDHIQNDLEDGAEASVGLFADN